MTRLRLALVANAVFLLAFTFPLQVISGSPHAALLPYAALCGACLLFLLSGRRVDAGPATSRVSLFVGVFLGVVLVNIAWFGVARGAGWYAAALGIFIYAVPALYFGYFRYLATDGELRTALIAVAVIGLANGAWWAHDSYYKLLPGRIDGYSVMVYEYALSRGASASEAAVWWVSPWQRSVGLLESFTVTAAWVAFGCFAALALIPKEKHYWRAATIFAYGFLLVIGSNFTAIVVFSCVIAIVELRAHRMLFGKFPKELKYFLYLATAWLLGIATIGFAFDAQNMARFAYLLGSKLVSQIGLVTGATPYSVNSATYVGGFFEDMAGFFDPTMHSPVAYVLGDFITATGRYGGDFGILETAHILGLPLLILTLLGLFRLLGSAVRDIGISRTTPSPALFATMLIAYVVAVEIHYSVWRAKSVLPMMFVALALLDRRREPFVHQEGAKG